MIARIHEIIRAEISDHVRRSPAPEIHSDADLTADLAMDALDRCCVTVAMDEEFGIMIPDSAMEGWETVADIERTIQQMVGALA